MGAASAAARRRVALWAIAAAMSSVPQLVAAVRAADLSGVSVAAWGASAVSSALWIVHGAVDGFPAVVVASVVWLAVSTAIVAVVLRRRPGRMLGA